MAEWPNIAVRFGLFADLMLLFGAACFGLYAFRGEERQSGRVVRFGVLLPALALGGLLLSVAGMGITLTSLTGSRLSEVDAETAGILINDTALGTAWKVRLAALVVALLAGALLRSPALKLWVCSSASGAALGSLAWGGHAAAGEGVPRIIDLTSDVFHLLAAGVWLGALFVLVLMLFSRTIHSSAEEKRFAYRSLQGFSSIGTIVVILLTLTGLLQGWRRVGVGELLSLPDTPYGQLLLIKLALFGFMLWLASLNRFRLTPALGLEASSRASLTVKKLQASLALEAGAALAVLGLVAWFGTLEPPVPTS